MAPTGISTAYSFQKVGDRYYDPTLLCFLTRDTELDELPYAYCGGDPVNCTDPDGHKWKWLQDLGKWLSGLFGGSGGVSVTVDRRQTGGTETFKKDPSTFTKNTTTTVSPNGTVTTQTVTQTTRGGVTITKTGPGSSTTTTVKVGGK